MNHNLDDILIVCVIPNPIIKWQKIRESTLFTLFLLEDDEENGFTIWSLKILKY